jgi:hypothetical protein
MYCRSEEVMAENIEDGTDSALWDDGAGADKIGSALWDDGAGADKTGSALWDDEGDDTIAAIRESQI